MSGMCCHTGGFGKSIHRHVEGPCHLQGVVCLKRTRSRIGAALIRLNTTQISASVERQLAQYPHSQASSQANMPLIQLDLSHSTSRPSLHELVDNHRQAGSGGSPLNAACLSLAPTQTTVATHEKMRE